MQIVIPMSGYGERFRAAGYTVPKPLIEVEGKPIIQHVVEMFSNDDDFVIATGKQFSVKHFINIVAKELKMKIIWRGTGINEKAYDKKNNIIIECSKKYFRPSEVQTLLGSPLKARKVLKWIPKISIEELAKEMVQNDLKLLSSK